MLPNAHGIVHEIRIIPPNRFLMTACIADYDPDYSIRPIIFRDRTICERDEEGRMFFRREWYIANPEDVPERITEEELNQMYRSVRQHAIHTGLEETWYPGLSMAPWDIFPEYSSRVANFSTWNFGMPMTAMSRGTFPNKYTEAKKRANALLLSLLTKKQVEEYETTGMVTQRISWLYEVIIEREWQTNLIMRNRITGKKTRLCCHISTKIPVADNMAAQLLWLRSNPKELLKIAKISPTG
jgi:hypothetical protein